MNNGTSSSPGPYAYRPHGRAADGGRCRSQRAYFAEFTGSAESADRSGRFWYLPVAARISPRVHGGKSPIRTLSLTPPVLNSETCLGSPLAGDDRGERPGECHRVIEQRLYMRGNTPPYFGQGKPRWNGADPVAEQANRSIDPAFPQFERVATSF